MSRHSPPALLLVATLLAACGGGGGGEAAPPAPPVDRRVTLAQYAPGAPVQPLTAQAQEASDYRFATLPLAEGVGAQGLPTLVVPALSLAQRALLIQASSGATLNDLLAQTGDPRGLAAGALQREVVAQAEQRFEPAWLQASERGSAHAAAPARWSVRSLAAWNTELGAIPNSLSPTLLVRDAMTATWAWAPTRFEGLFQRDDGRREQRPMLRIPGEVWQFSEPTFSAQGLLLAGGAQLVKLRPTQGSAREFATSPQLGEALLRLNQRLRAGVSRGAGSLVLGDAAPGFLDPQFTPDPQLLGEASKPFALLDGRPQYARLTRSTATLGWSASSLGLGGNAQLLFINAGSLTGNTGGILPVDIGRRPPRPCPDLPADLRPELLLGLDAQLRLLWIAYAPEQGSEVADCL